MEWAVHSSLTHYTWKDIWVVSVFDSQVQCFSEESSLEHTYTFLWVIHPGVEFLDSCLPMFSSSKSCSCSSSQPISREGETQLLHVPTHIGAACLWSESHCWVRGSDCSVPSVTSPGMSTWLTSATLGQAIRGGKRVKGMPGSAPSGPLREDRVCSQEQRRRRELTSAVQEGASSLNPPPTLKGPRTSCAACRLTLRKLSPSPLNSHPVCELTSPLYLLPDPYYPSIPSGVPSPLPTHWTALTLSPL